MKLALLLGVALALGTIALVPSAQAHCNAGDAGCCLTEESNTIFRALCVACVAAIGTWSSGNACVLPP